MFVHLNRVNKYAQPTDCGRCACLFTHGQCIDKCRFAAVLQSHEHNVHFFRMEFAVVNKQHGQRRYVPVDFYGAEKILQSLVRCRKSCNGTWFVSRPEKFRKKGAHRRGGCLRSTRRPGFCCVVINCKHLSNAHFDHIWKLFPSIKSNENKKRMKIHIFETENEGTQKRRIDVATQTPALRTLLPITWSQLFCNRLGNMVLRSSCLFWSTTIPRELCCSFHLDSPAKASHADKLITLSYEDYIFWYFRKSS